jgi:hypothetical protein
MALIAPTAVPVAGSVNPTATAVSSSDTIAYQPGLVLVVINAGGSTDNVVQVFPGTHVSGQPNPDTANMAVPATTGRGYMLIHRDAVDPATGLVTITHSFTTTVTCLVLAT